MRTCAQKEKVVLVHQAYFGLIFFSYLAVHWLKKPVIVTLKNVLVNIYCKPHPKAKQNLNYYGCPEEFCWLNLSKQTRKR